MGSIPSELYFGMDVFQTPTTGKGHSLKNLLLFDEDHNSSAQKEIRKNILIKKKMQSVNDFFDVVDVYNAQTQHGEQANDIFFDVLHNKINAETQAQQLVNGTWHNLHPSSKKHRHERDDSSDFDADDLNKDSLSSNTNKQTPHLLKISYKSDTDLFDATIPNNNNKSSPYRNRRDTNQFMTDSMMY